MAYTRVMTPDNSPSDPGPPQPPLPAGRGGRRRTGGRRCRSARTGPRRGGHRPRQRVVQPAGRAAAATRCRWTCRTSAARRQVVAVMTPSWTAIHGTIEAWEKDGADIWHQVMAPSNANIGLNGWVLGSERIQGDHKTPAGIYRIHRAFGRYSNPGSGTPLRASCSPATTGPETSGTPRPTTSSSPAAPRPRRGGPASPRRSTTRCRPTEYVACIDFNLAGGIHRQSDGQYVASQPANIRLRQRDLPALLRRRPGRTATRWAAPTRAWPRMQSGCCAGSTPPTRCRPSSWARPG